MILKHLGWHLVALSGGLMTLVGLVLPILPHMPFVFLLLYALFRLYPNWLRRRKLYRLLVSPYVRNRHHKINLNVDSGPFKELRSYYRLIIYYRDKNAQKANTDV